MKYGRKETNVAMVKLSERERRILDFERTWWKEPGSKQAAIRHHFHLSPTRYYQLVADLVSRPAAESYDPLVVRRIRRMQSQRRRTRYEGPERPLRAGQPGPSASEPTSR